MNWVWNRITREALVVIVGALVVSFVFNFVRESGIPLMADAEAFRVQTNAEFAHIEDALRLFKEGRAIFIDARAPEIYSSGHIEGAINAPPGGPQVEGLAWLADADTYVICYASEQNQRQAGVVADRLIEMGCERVYILMGGFEAWETQGLPVDGLEG